MQKSLTPTPTPRQPTFPPPLALLPGSSFPAPLLGGRLGTETMQQQGQLERPGRPRWLWDFNVRNPRASCQSLKQSAHVTSSSRAPPGSGCQQGCGYRAPLSWVPASCPTLPHIFLWFLFCCVSPIFFPPASLLSCPAFPSQKLN